jgi:hypothetical protein
VALGIDSGCGWEVTGRRRQLEAKGSGGGGRLDRDGRVRVRRTCV